MKQYCLGMAVWGEKILLVEKQRTIAKIHEPMWNFPGGKVESGEKPRVALSREVLEETGTPIFQHNWMLMGKLLTKDHEGKIEVLCYRTQSGVLKLDHDFDKYKGAHRSEWLHYSRIWFGEEEYKVFMPDLQALVCLMWGDFNLNNFTISIP